jgi:hypothetical protein
MQHFLRINIICFFAVLAAAGSTRGAAPLVVPVDGKPFHGKLSSIDADWKLTFNVAGKPQSLPMADLVRWGNPPETTTGPIVVTAAGGLLVADVFAADKESLSCDSRLFGDVKLPLGAMAGVLLYPPSDQHARDILIDRVSSATGNSDRLILHNGDSLSGMIEGVKNDTVKLKTEAASVSIETHRISAMIFNPALREPAPRVGVRCWVGFSDGSRLLATKLLLSPASLAITTAVGETWKTSPEEVVYLQPLGGRVVYLSDLKATGYRHLPFLQTKWPYKIDRNVTGGQLRGGGVLYAKGIGLHSAARLTYLLDRPYKRFEAELGVDDSTKGGGSVRFRVYVDGKERHGSRVIRGDDKPLPVSVNLDKARRLDIIVDFADRADQLDHADWLDARLVK